MNDWDNASFPPYVRDRQGVAGIMGTVLFALLFPAGYGVWHFGWKALLILAVSVATCVISEYISEKALRRPATVGDLSAAVTGLLLGMSLPASVDWWLPVVGGLFAIVVVKQLFGGLGQNWVNPALMGRCFLFLCFTEKMQDFTFDGLTGATPLVQLGTGEELDVLNMVVGSTPGAIGETSAILILLGAAVLLAQGVIDLKIPAAAILAFTAFMSLFGGHGFDLPYLVGHLAGGGLMLGVWFMATDYTTRPITPKGQILYGAAVGVLAGLFRCSGPFAEGISFAILIANLLSPAIEGLTVPRPSGGSEKAKKVKSSVKGESDEQNGVGSADREVSGL